MEPYIQFIALFLLALVTGVFWGPWLALHRTNQVFAPAEFIHIVQVMVKNLGAPMRILMPVCILFIALSTCFYPQTGSLGFYFSITSLILSIIALIVTLVVEVPIVNQIILWNAAAIPANWEAIRDRWKFFHVVRILASLGSVGCLVISLLFLSKG